MRSFLRSISAALIAALLTIAAVPAAIAQTTVPAVASVGWTLPTTTSTGLPLTGPAALTAINLYVDVNAIPDAGLAAPSVVLSATSTTTTYTATVANNATLHIRLSACNIGGCSPLTAEQTKQVTVPVPGVPTQVTFTITIKTS